MTTVDTYTGNDTVPIMTMNCALIDEHSPEYRSRLRNITLLPPSVMLDALAAIEEVFTEFVDDNDQAFRQVEGPFYILN
jgi:hypothetical protein